MNSFWEGFEKRAWDGDYERDGEYGIQANRAMGPKHDLHKTLLTASKDPNFIVKIWTPENDEISGHKNIKKHIEGLKKKYPEHGGYTWERDHVWSVGAKSDGSDKSKNRVFKDIYRKHMHKIKGGRL